MQGMLVDNAHCGLIGAITSKTDGIVWVVDSCDAVRMQDCRAELWALLGEEVCVLREHLFAFAHAYMSTNARS